jgi:hypothetical protein
VIVLDVLGFGNCFRSERKEENLLSGNWISVGSSLTFGSNRAVTEITMKISKL